MDRWKAGEPNVQPGHNERHKQNLNTFNSPQFKRYCEGRGIEVTMRQASKYRRRK